MKGITSKIKSFLDLKQKESKLVVFKDFIPFIPFIPVKMFLVLVFYFDSAESLPNNKPRLIRSLT
jgi:hypothetical protein